MDYPHDQGGAGGFTPLEEVLVQWARKAPEPRRAAALWSLVTGSQISRRSRIRGAASGRVEVSVTDEKWRAVLRDMSADILRKLNRAAGERAYHSLHVEVE